MYYILEYGINNDAKVNIFFKKANKFVIHLIKI